MCGTRQGQPGAYCNGVFTPQAAFAPHPLYLQAPLLLSRKSPKRPLECFIAPPVQSSPSHQHRRLAEKQTHKASETHNTASFVRKRKGIRVRRYEHPLYRSAIRMIPNCWPYKSSVLNRLTCKEEIGSFVPNDGLVAAQSLPLQSFSLFGFCSLNTQHPPSLPP